MSDDQLVRMQRVADQLTTCHSILRDKFGRRALTLDVGILSLSVIVTALAFLDPKFVEDVKIFGVSPQILIGFLGCVTFVLSLVQLRVDWKQRADRHEQGARAYAAIKLAIGALLDQGNFTAEQRARAVGDYHTAGDRHIAIPENLFNRLKQKHLKKAEISKFLSDYPGTSITLIKFKLWIRDTIGLLKNG